jgi:signal peptidase II
MKKLINSPYTPFIIILLILLGDGLTKYFTHLHLPVMQRYSLWYPYGGVPIFQNFMGIEFSLSHQINTGAAWGMLASYQVPLLYFRIILILVLIIYTIFFIYRSEQRIPLAMIIAGAIGNVLDYYFYGHVVDMIHFVFWGYDFPIFNLADTSIFLGIASLLILECFEKKAVTKKRK